MPVIRYKDRKPDQAHPMIIEEGAKRVQAHLDWCKSLSMLLQAPTRIECEGLAATGSQSRGADGATWAESSVRVKIDSREDVTPGKKIRHWLARGVPLLLAVQLSLDAEALSADGTRPALVHLQARDKPGIDICVKEVSAAEAAWTLRQELVALHERLLAAHRAASMVQ